jgi:hypothetical protein
MSTTPINNLSTGYFESSLSADPKSAKQSLAGDKSLSTFSQLLSTSASSDASGTVAGSSSKTSTPNQMLMQLMQAFQSSGIQNEGSAVDPMSIA